MKLPSEAVAPYLYVHGQFDTLDKVRQYEAEILIELENRRIRADKAEKELSELKERTRWIPCSERLPELNSRVLTHNV